MAREAIKVLYQQLSDPSSLSAGPTTVGQLNSAAGDQSPTATRANKIQFTLAPISGRRAIAQDRTALVLSGAFTRFRAYGSLVTSRERVTEIGRPEAQALLAEPAALISVAAARITWVLVISCKKTCVG